MRSRPILAIAGIATAATLMLLQSSSAAAQGSSSVAVQLAIKDHFDVPVADAKSEAIVAAADAFLATLSASQRQTAVYDFTDNAQRSNWSNLPDGLVQRGGVMLGDLSEAQRTSLDALLAEFMSEEGFTNIIHQLFAEDTLRSGSTSRINFSSDVYFASFLGEPSTTEPWMFQFGGHHLAINTTVFGPSVSFAPMLTGGQPMRITYEGEEILIAERETTAAQALMENLSDAQKKLAVRSSRTINLLLGPGKDNTVLAPEGIKGSELSDEQKVLLLEVIRARLGFINDDDFGAKMVTVEAELDDAYFGWWGPQGTPGTAYFRVTGPSIVLEYAPQRTRGGEADHVHSMYREPANDYGAQWIGAD